MSGQWVPMCLVKSVRGKGPHHTLHSDVLLHCKFLPFDAAPEETTKAKVSRKRSLRDREAPH